MQCVRVCVCMCVKKYAENMRMHLRRMMSVCKNSEELPKCVFRQNVKWILDTKWDRARTDALDASE